MQGAVVSTAGREPPKSQDPRRDAIRLVRQVLRDPASTDDQVDDALEALAELSRES